MESCVPQGFPVGLSSDLLFEKKVSTVYFIACVLGIDSLFRHLKQLIFARHLPLQLFWRTQEQVIDQFPVQLPVQPHDIPDRRNDIFYEYPVIVLV